MGFSWKRIGKIIAVIVVAVALAAGAYFLAISRQVKIAWASLAHDRRENFFDCEHLPFYAQVQKAFNQHADIVARVKMAGGVSDFFPEQIPCKIYDRGTKFMKGDGVLKYQNRSGRLAAEKIIGQDFFGFPYRGEPAK